MHKKIRDYLDIRLGKNSIYSHLKDRASTIHFAATLGNTDCDRSWDALGFMEKANDPMSKA